MEPELLTTTPAFTRPIGFPSLQPGVGGLNIRLIQNPFIYTPLGIGAAIGFMKTGSAKGALIGAGVTLGISFAVLAWAFRNYNP